MSESSNQKQDRFVSHLTRNTIALILAGGRVQLKDMTEWRAKPAVPFAASFALLIFRCPTA
jgi:glucose-1-phosphate adenylyltransferase